MNKISLAFAVVLLSGAVCASRADDGAKKDMPPQKPVSKELEQVKQLAGTWKGSANMGGTNVPTSSVFHVIAGGSAVIETMDPGTPHEMVNVYHDVDGQLAVTHYCALGNAPEMRLIKGHGLAFEAIKANGIDPEKDAHMHGLALSLADKDHLTTTWTSSNVPKEHAPPSVFTYARVAP